MTTLSLKASKKVFELVGEYETEDFTEEVEEPWTKIIPRPTFSELIRVMPRIGEKKGWMKIGGAAPQDTFFITTELAWLYAIAPTEPEGMKDVEDYLLKLL